MFTIAIRNDPPPFESRGKYAELRQMFAELPLDKWLVLSGFADEQELNQVQSGLNSSSGHGLRQDARRAGYLAKTKRYVSDGKIELWIRKVVVTPPASK